MTSFKDFLNVIGTVGTHVLDADRRTRIFEIDEKIAKLQAERQELIDDLIDPSDYKTETETTTPGRLTKCGGRWSDLSNFHDAHPACPYLKTKHIAHEFTLRD